MKLTALRPLASAFALALTLSGCGSAERGGNTSSKDTPPVAGQGESQVLALGDDEEAQASISVNVDESLSAAADDGEPESSPSFSLASHEEGPAGGVKRYRSCSEDAASASAVVKLKRSISREQAYGPRFDGKQRIMLIKDDLKQTRTWSKEGVAVQCSENGKSVQLKRSELEGMKLVLESNRSRSRTWVIDRGMHNGVEGYLDMSLKGTREVQWVKVEAKESALHLTTQHAIDSSGTLRSKRKNGQRRDIESSVKTPSDAPLVVLTERDAQSDALLGRTIVSGKTVSLTRSGRRIETNFDNVKYLPSSKCYAVSGSISGSISDKGASEIAATYVIEFTGKERNIVITRKDGSVVTKPYLAEGCEFEAQKLEATPGAVVEAPSESAVQPALGAPEQAN